MLRRARPSDPLAMSGRRLLRAVTRSIEEEEGRKAILKHFVARPARVQELYAEMVEDVFLNGIVELFSTVFWRAWALMSGVVVRGSVC